MLINIFAAAAAGWLAGWLMRGAKAERDICRYLGPRTSVSRGKTGPDEMDIPAIWR